MEVEEQEQEEKKKIIGERVSKERKAAHSADKYPIKVPVHLKHPLHMSFDFDDEDILGMCMGDKKWMAKNSHAQTKMWATAPAYAWLGCRGNTPKNILKTLQQSNDMSVRKWAWTKEIAQVMTASRANSYPNDYTIIKGELEVAKSKLARALPMLKETQTELGRLKHQRKEEDHEHTTQCARFQEEKTRAKTLLKARDSEVEALESKLKFSNEKVDTLTHAFRMLTDKAQEMLSTNVELSRQLDAARNADADLTRELFQNSRPQDMGGKPGRIDMRFIAQKQITRGDDDADSGDDDDGDDGAKDIDSILGKPKSQSNTRRARRRNRRRNHQSDFPTVGPSQTNRLTTRPSSWPSASAGRDRRATRGRGRRSAAPIFGRSCFRNTLRARTSRWLSAL